MEMKKIHYIGIGAAVLIIALSFLFRDTKLFFLIIGIGVLAGALPFVITLINESKAENEKEEMFLEFTRNLVESVKTGTPISKSIMNVKDKGYGVLGENIKKLANQISLGIPINLALQVFAKDVGNQTVSRTIILIGQAEKAGGDIGEILESVAEAVSLSDKLKKERKAAISTLVVQGYIIFFVFMIIILIMQFQILPMVSGIAELGTIGGGSFGEVGIATGGGAIEQEQLSNSFLWLLLIQGFFTGLTIGKLGEGSIKVGVKHSFALMLVSFVVSTGANIILGA
ncbi:MAG: type II secretion system F family protein [Candidatus Pacearchaeota archaeon]|nr:type II secretion system F family protein [Candidatus Pacearchaeota archaeon]